MTDNAPLAGKRVLLGVSGSIAAYKSADLCSRLSKLGAEVHVVMTSSAMHFVGEATMRALTRRSVMTDLFDEPHSDRIAHIDLAQSSDIVVVAPATANLIAKMAVGIADDILTTCLLAVPKSTPLLVAPAMNSLMLEHPATQHNLATLRDRGVEILATGYGVLACQDVGYGKMAEPDEIVTAINLMFSNRGDFCGKRVLVTAGPTREPLDPVRYIGNRSSGKMGYALAQAAVRRGASVILVSGPTALASPPGVELVRVQTAEQMLAECMKAAPDCNVIIGAAAVADYRPAKVADSKMKRQSGVSITIELVPNEDIIAALTSHRSPGQFIVGFAAETDNVEQNAARKLTSKGLDLVVSNDVSRPDAGFDVDTNAVTLHWPGGNSEDLPLQSKLATADHILTRIAAAMSHV